MASSEITLVHPPQVLLTHPPPHALSLTKPTPNNQLLTTYYSFLLNICHGLLTPPSHPGFGATASTIHSSHPAPLCPSVLSLLNLSSAARPPPTVSAQQHLRLKLLIPNNSSRGKGPGLQPLAKVPVKGCLLHVPVETARCQTRMARHARAGRRLTCHAIAYEGPTGLA